MFSKCSNFNNFGWRDLNECSKDGEFYVNFKNGQFDQQNINRYRGMDHYLRAGKYGSPVSNGSDRDNGNERYRIKYEVN